MIESWIKIIEEKKIVLIGLFIGATVNMITEQHQHHEGCIHSKGYAAMDSEGKMIPYSFKQYNIFKTIEK